MNWQFLFLGLFLLNLILFWSLKKHLWYRVIGLILMGFIPLVTVFVEQPHFQLDYYWWRLAGVVAILLGCFVAGWAKIEFLKSGMWPFSEPQKVVKTGPYAFIRHPLYLGLIFFLVGWWWIWATVYSFYFGMFILLMIWVQAWLEEKLIMEKKFPEEYKAYKKQTGMFWIK
ncbi:MAG: isoprenylcysteine carboxylmethyltransferase family protein [Candidatus Saganbacteria bacterium]|nr:isoprenylcysteine carboxylmethyltransferase family protein [Candidatus Saganbacteria bacterium]